MKHSKLLLGSGSIFGSWIISIILWTMFKDSVSAKKGDKEFLGTLVLCFVIVPIISYLIWYFSSDFSLKKSSGGLKGKTTFIIIGIAGVIACFIWGVIAHHGLNESPIFAISALITIIGQTFAYWLGEPV